MRWMKCYMVKIRKAKGEGGSCRWERKHQKNARDEGVDGREGSMRLR